MLPFAARLQAIAAAILLFAAPTHAAQSHVIPFEMTESGHMVVELTLNGSAQVSAVLDTGANFPLLGRESAELIGVELPEDYKTVDIVGLGAMATFPVVHVDNLAFGDISLNSVAAAYNSRFDIPGAGNIIPSNSIPHRTLDFDFRESRLLAYDRKPMGVGRSSVSRLPVTWQHGLPFVEVSVNGRDGLALIDTGASVSYINSVFANTAARSPDALRTIELVGATGAVVPIRILSSRKFVLGEFKINHYDVIVSDPEFLTHYGLQDEPVMVLGLDVLRQFRVQIDRLDSRLVLSRPYKGVRLSIRPG